MSGHAKILTTLLFIVVALAALHVTYSSKDELKVCEMRSGEKYCCAMIGGYKKPSCVEWRKEQ